MVNTSYNQSYVSSMKYSRQMLERAAKNSKSVFDVLRHLGLEPGRSGGMHWHIRKRMDALGIDTSHFLGARANRGENHKGGPKKLVASEILVRNRLAGQKERTVRLRRAMLQYGFKYLCNHCSQEPLWRGKKLVLQIEHKDGDVFNNEPSNLEFLCPNCHSQTETYGKTKNARVEELADSSVLGTDA